MILYLSTEQVLELHREAILQHGGDPGIRDLGLIESAVAQPRMTYGGEDLYPTLEEKAAALGFSLITNHGFLDGNKRVGFAAMDVFLRANGFKIEADVDLAESTVLSVATGKMSRDEFMKWVQSRKIPVQN